MKRDGWRKENSAQINKNEFSISNRVFLAHCSRIVLYRCTVLKFHFFFQKLCRRTTIIQIYILIEAYSIYIFNTRNTHYVANRALLIVVLEKRKPNERSPTQWMMNWKTRSFIRHTYLTWKSFRNSRWASRPSTRPWPIYGNYAASTCSGPRSYSAASFCLCCWSICKRLMSGVAASWVAYRRHWDARNQPHALWICRAVPVTISAGRKCVSRALPLPYSVAGRTWRTGECGKSAANYSNY